MTQIYYATIEEARHETLMKQYAHTFSTSFLERLLRFRRWQDAQLSLLGRLLVKYAFEKNGTSFSEKELIYSDHSKPLLENHPLSFNISHSGDLAICIISDLTDVGIDIEQMRNIEIEDFKSQMTNLEWQRVISAASIKLAFFDYWTQKEAVIKANGHGLSIPLKSFEVIDSASEIDPDTFYVQQVHIKADYRCHIAFKNKKDSELISPVSVDF